LEKYLYDSCWKHANATERPPLGVEFLDNGPPRPDAMMRCEVRGLA
jgi:hypothetical protein